MGGSCISRQLISRGGIERVGMCIARRKRRGIKGLRPKDFVRDVGKGNKVRGVLRWRY